MTRDDFYQSLTLWNRVFADSLEYETNWGKYFPMKYICSAWLKKKCIFEMIFGIFLTLLSKSHACLKNLIDFVYAFVDIFRTDEIAKFYITFWWKSPYLYISRKKSDKPNQKIINQFSLSKTCYKVYLFALLH